jgi:subtilisin family serine protease
MVTKGSKGRKRVEEPTQGVQMPTGEMEEKAVANEISVSGMRSMESAMPAMGMAESASTESEMNVGGMPMGVMGERGSGDDRFPPTSLPPGAVPPSAFEPGIVEVEFREGVRPQIMPATAGAPSTIASPAGVNLGGLNQILQLYQLERAESSFQISEHEATQAQAVAQQQGVAVPNLGNFVTLHFPEDADTQRIAQELSRLPAVERAVAVPKAIPPQTPLNEPLVGTSGQVVLNPVTGLENQWYIYRCRANNAWSMASGNGVVIADIDWGYRTSHQDLATRLDLNHAYNAYDGGSNVSTGGSVSHGTAVMGIAGGADNDLGMCGIAFGATLWPVQADSGPGTALGGNSWARAIDWVRTADSSGRRKVINLEVQTGSFGNYEMVPSVNAAIRTAIAHGIVVCVAAGNGDRDAGIDDSGSPIPETGSILVGATEYHATQNRRAGFSNFGQRIVVCAPGDASHDLTCSSSSDSAYRNGFGGTSGATPKVAGTAALILEANPNLTHAEIRTILNATGSEVITDAGKPVGSFLNAEAAVRAAVRPIASGRSVVSWGPNRLDAFVVGSDSRLYHKWWNGSAWGPSLTGYEDMGGLIINSPEVVSWGPNRLDAFVVGSDSRLYHKWWNGSAWGPSLTGYEDMGGTIIGQPRVVSWGPDRLDVFVVGANSRLYHKWWDGSAWGPSLTGYEDMGGTISRF